MKQEVKQVAGEFVSVLCQIDPRPTNIETEAADDTICVSWQWKKCQFTALVKRAEEQKTDGKLY